MTVLKPCPFCGEDLIHQIDWDNWIHNLDEKGNETTCIGNQLLVRDFRATVSAWNTRASQWQPIETAPKWEYVLVWDGEDVEMAQKNKTSWWTVQDAEDIEFGEEMDPQPTHWMPIPEGPQS